MLNEITVKGFRKYEELSIKNLDRVNFILGNNNIGKTSVLEAIYAWACGQNIFPFINIPLSRGRYSGIQQPYWIMEEIMSVVNNRKKLPLNMSFSGLVDDKEVCFNHNIYPSDLLTDYDSSYKKTMENIIPRTNDILQKETLNPFSQSQSLFPLSPPMVIAKWDVEHNGNSVSEHITLPLAMVSRIKPFQLAKFIDVLSHVSVSETVQIYSSLKREKLIDNVTNEINKVFPEIAGFDMLPYPDGSQAPISIIKNDGSLLPIYAYGDGIQRWFYILGAIALYKNAIICIDEIDTGFHPDAQLEFNKHLVQYAKNNNVQLFITTHNIEYVDKFLKSVNELGKIYSQEARVITLREIDHVTRVRTISADEAIKLRDDYRLELR